MAAIFPKESPVARMARECEAPEEDQFASNFISEGIRRGLLDGALDFYYHQLGEGKTKNCYTEGAFMLNAANQAFVHRTVQLVQRAASNVWGPCDPAARLEHLFQEFMVFPQGWGLGVE